VRIGLADKIEHCGLQRDWEPGSHSYDLATPEKWLQELRVHSKRVLAVLFGDEDVQQFASRRNGGEDLASNPERAEVMVWLLRYLREREGDFPDCFQCHCHGSSSKAGGLCGLTFELSRPRRKAL
jgi:hypothetical protein